MTNEEKIVLLEKLTDNDAFLADIAKAESKDQLQEVFANYGLELTRDEVDAFVAKLNSTASGELNEDSLDDVAGGVSVTALWVFSTAAKGIKKIAKTCWNAGKKLANWEDGR